MSLPITYSTAASRTVAMMILATPIRRDAEGRFCLNDLHRAAGGEDRHGPKRWMVNASTHEVIAALKDENPSFEPVDLSRGRYGGTYAVEDLALSYAMWISPKFHLTVVRGFKETRKTHETDVGDAIVPAGSSLVSILEQALVSERRRLELEAQIEASQPKVDYAEATMADDRTVSVREAAKQFGLSDQRLTALLIDARVLFRQGKSVLPYQRYIDDGSFVLKGHRVTLDYIRRYPHVTGKGLLLLHRLVQKSAMH